MIPVCGEDETEIVLQTMGGDSLNDLGIFVSLYWNLTTDLGQYVELVYDYDEVSTQLTAALPTVVTTSTCTTTVGSLDTEVWT